jgi:hypothetical protein
MAEREEDLLAALATDGDVAGVLGDEAGQDDPGIGDAYTETYRDEPPRR